MQRESRLKTSELMKELMNFITSTALILNEESKLELLDFEFIPQ